MSIETLADTLLERLKTMAQAETVVGKPIQAGTATIIPVTKVSLGFGFGSHTGTGELQGSGGGAQLDPVAFLVINGDDIRVLPVHKDSSLLEKVYDIVPDLLSKLTSEKD